MADPRGFLNVEPQKPTPRPVHLRIRDYDELYQPMPAESFSALRVSPPVLCRSMNKQVSSLGTKPS